MKTTKLREVLLELKSERQAIDRAMSALEAIIQGVNGDANPIDTAVSTAMDTRRRLDPTYIDLSVDVLTEHRKPMNIKELTYKVGLLKGKDVQRNSLEPTIHRHANESKTPRIVKVGPAFYALPEWPREIKDLWSQEASAS